MPGGAGRGRVLPGVMALGYFPFDGSAVPSMRWEVVLHSTSPLAGCQSSAVLRTPDKKDPNMEKGFSCRAFSYTGWQGPSRDAEAGGVAAVT